MSDHLGTTHANAESFSSNFLRRAGEGLMRGDSYFREVLDALPAAIYITDAAGRITYYNAAAATLWGHRPELGKGRWCGSWKLYWPDGRPLPHHHCPMAIALREARPIRGMEAVAERPDGVRVAFIPYPTPLFDSSGTLVGAVNMLVDITERKRAEEYSQRIASIVEFSDDPIMSQDAEGAITSWNRGAERLFGYQAEEAIGSPITIITPPDRLREETQILEQIRRGESIAGYDTVRQCKDGSLVEVALTASPIKNAQGKIIGVSKITRNITDRKRAEEYAQRLVAIVESSDDAIVAKNLDGVILSWNGGAQKLFGYTPEEAIGQSVTMLIPFDRQDEEPAILARIRNGERVEHFDTIRQRKDGSLVHISLTISPIKDSKGKIVGASKVARDITARRSAEERQRLLLREMNHRVKNLFALASSVVALSARSAQTPQGLAAAVRDRLAALAQAHALTLSKISDDAELGETSTTLHALIRAITAPFDDHGESDSRRVVISGPDLKVPSGSVTSFALLLHEFATNAAKYGALSTANGRIKVKCIEQDKDFIMTWHEEGGPLIEREPENKGFGSFLARTAVQSQLGGEIVREWKPEGLSIRLSIDRGRL